MRGRVAVGGVVLLLALAAVPPAGAVPGSVSADSDQLPSLAAIPPTMPGDVHIGETDDGDGSAIRLAAGSANRGDYALDLLAEPTDPSGERASAHQCVAWATHRVCAERAEVGGIYWHADHGHFHFEDYALYELRLLDEHGEPDLSEDGFVVSSGKVSFCLIDQQQDGDPPHPVYEAPHPLYFSCAAGVGYQGISPGWKDIYPPRREGQQIPIDGVADGEYALVVTIDPEKRLHEADRDANVASARIRLLGDGSDVEIVW